jgi:hypothetical protein
MAIEYLDGGRIIGLSTDTKPTNVPSGSTFIETDTGNIQFFNGTLWFVKPFESINASFGRNLGYNPRQHMIEWFSGHSLNTDRWTSTTDGTTTSAMDDSINGGYKMTATGDSQNFLSFNNIREFNNSCTMIFIASVALGGSGGSIIGFGESYNNFGSATASATLQWDSGNSGSDIHILSSDGSTQQNGTGTGWSRTEGSSVYHVFKIEVETSSITVSRDGIIGSTVETTRVPPPHNNASRMQPRSHIEGYSGSGVNVTNLRYMECWNT